MKLRFTKMHGLGNDFVVIDAINQVVDLAPEQARFISDRRFGVGCDQILIVERPTRPDVDFRYRIFNSDGSEVEQCGNGARCFVHFVREHGLSSAREIRVETRSGIIVPRMGEDGLVTVDMGVPILKPARIPFISDSSEVVQSIDLDGTSVAITAVSMGNPHAVQVVADVAATPVETQGPLIERHPRFPARVNAGFMQVIDAHTIRLRVFERGAGETLACGTGACAAVVAGIRRELLSSPVTVHTRGGDLSIAWDGLSEPVMMTGPAVAVFEGEIVI
ncbi:MAG TPA: diaminopimelate epimerase [Rhodocyclaceae bacterium]|nr:diaminopimelate epimerase [Rhodocyclaceae bacterium]